MRNTFAKSVGMSAAVIGALALLILPGRSGAEVSIPEDCEVAIQVHPGPCQTAKPPKVEPPKEESVSILPVDVPASVLPVEPVPRSVLLLWVRRGETLGRVTVPCGERCPLAERLLGASRPRPERKCRALPGTVRAGGWWQGQLIGPFHNRNTCEARKWRAVAGVFDRLLPA